METFIQVPYIPKATELSLFEIKRSKPLEEVIEHYRELFTTEEDRQVKDHSLIQCLIGECKLWGYPSKLSDKVFEEGYEFYIKASGYWIQRLTVEKRKNREVLYNYIFSKGKIDLSKVTVKVTISTIVPVFNYRNVSKREAYTTEAAYTQGSIMSVLEYSISRLDSMLFSWAIRHEEDYNPNMIIFNNSTFGGYKLQEYLEFLEGYWSYLAEEDFSIGGISYHDKCVKGLESIREFLGGGCATKSARR